jgi:hypothetical protein
VVKKKHRFKAPFPAFGGKSTIAPMAWERIGDVDNAIEPFCRSAAWLLARPHPGRIETLNDIDCYVANFWRAVKFCPDLVAEYADWPVNEADLHARHRFLVGVDWPEPTVPEPWDRHPSVARLWMSAYAEIARGRDWAEAFRSMVRSDSFWFDPRVAGWWVWGCCQWIGGGWCEYNDGPDRRPILSHGAQNAFNSGPDPRSPMIGGLEGQVGRGINAGGPKQQIPLIEGHYGSSGRGVHSPAGNGTAELYVKRPKISSEGSIGVGVHANDHRPQLADAYDVGRGVHSAGEIGTCAARRAWLEDWMRRLQDRLRITRVCCGGWKRVCWSESVTTRLGTVGLFMDPPYAKDIDRLNDWKRHLTGGGEKPAGLGKWTSRSDRLYASDAGSDVDRLVAEVNLYCRERGEDPRYRIALCGYAGEHEDLVALGWDEVPWKASGGYGARSEKGRENARRERIWFSPGCIKPAGSLF